MLNSCQDENLINLEDMVVLSCEHIKAYTVKLTSGEFFYL